MPSRLATFNWMTATRMAGLLVSFASQALLGAYFGAGWRMDAFWIGTSIAFFLDMALNQSMQKVFIPALAKMKNDPEEAQRFAGRFITMILLILSAIAIAGWALAQPIADLLAGGADPSTRALAASVLRITVFEVISAGLFSLSYGLHLTAGSFILPSLVNRTMGLGILAGMLFWVRPNLADPDGAIVLLAWIYLLSNIAQALLMVLALRKTSLRFKIRLDFLRPEILSALRAATPLIAAALFVRSMGLVDKWIGASLGEGAVSYLGYGMRLTQIPLALFGSLALLSFPAVSDRAEDAQRLWETVLKYYRASAMILLPFSIVSFVAAETIVAFIYLRGAFSPEDVLGAAGALRGYAVFMTLAFAGAPLMHPFYALRRNKTVMVAALLVALANAAISLALASVVGHIGVAWGTSSTFVLSSTLFWVLLIRIIQPDDWTRLPKDLLSLALVGAIAAAICYGLYRTLLPVWPWADGMSAQLSTLTLVSLAAFSAYGVGLKLVRFPELEWAVASMRKRSTESRK